MSWLAKPLGRAPFLAWGVALAAIKVALDYVVARAYGHPYSVLYYVSPIDAPLFHPGADRDYWTTLSFVALPFIGLGVALTVRRLVDAGISPWTALLFFVPFANLLFFGVAAAAPPRPRPQPIVLPEQAAYRAPGRPLEPAPPLPGRRWSILVAGLLGAVIGLGTLAVSVGLLKEYGAALMLGTPTIAGFATGAFYARLEPSAEFGRAALANIVATLITLAALVAFAIEGLGCLAMFLPLMMLPSMFGAYIGFGAAHALPPRATPTAIGGAVLSFFVVLGAEHVAPIPALEPPPVETSMEIDAPPERVWALLPSMAPMPAPDDWVFRTGIAFPLWAHTEGEGLGAKRSCAFTTGMARETIDRWEPGRALGFTIDAQPDPMREATIYRTVRQPHLDGYVRNVRGELLVEPLDGGRRAKVTAKSWYRVRITPETYWRWWSDAVVHHLHRRILVVVKARAEAPDDAVARRGTLDAP